MVEEIKRVTFEYEKLGQHRCYFETEEERQVAIDIFMADLRSYLDEGYEGDGDAWAPRTWDEVHRLRAMAYAVRDLRWKRDADGDGGIEIFMSPLAQGRTINVFVPRNPEDVAANEFYWAGKAGDPAPITDFQLSEWVASTLQKGSTLISYGKDLIAQATHHLEYKISIERDRIRFNDDWAKLIDFVANEAETPLAATEAYRVFAKKYDDVPAEREEAVAENIVARFDLERGQEDILAVVDEFAKTITSILSGTDYDTVAMPIAQRIIDFQDRYGELVAAKVRHRFNGVSNAWRESRGKATGLPRRHWRANGVPDAIRVGKEWFD